MSIATLEEFKAYLRENNGNADDPTLQTDLDAAEGAIADYCRRSFTVASGSSARVYTLNDACDLRFHDCTTVTSIVDAGGTVSASNYQLRPLNGLSTAGLVQPYRQAIRIVGLWTVTQATPTVTVTATWGWASIPTGVKRACLMIAKDQADMRNVKLGVAGFDAYGVVRIRQNTVASRLLDRYIRFDS